jgi:hypothetical protein
VIVALVSLGGSSSGGHGTTTGPTRRAGGSRAPASLRVGVERAGELPAALQDAAAAPGGSAEVRLMGGLDAEEASLADVLRLGGSVAQKVGTLATPTHDACASALSGDVYLFGGGEQTSFDGIYRVPATGAAQQVGSLPAPASDVACATLGDTIYIVGGYTGQEPLTTILAWRPGSSPRQVGTLPKPLRYAATAAVGADILIAGGTSGTAASSDIYAFDPPDGRVRALGRLPYPLTHAAGASLQGRLLVIGGRGEQQGSQRRGILAVSPTGAVSVAGTLPLALSDVAAAESGGVVTLAGGLDRNGVQHRAIMRLTAAG